MLEETLKLLLLQERSRSDRIRPACHVASVDNHMMTRMREKQEVFSQALLIKES